MIWKIPITWPNGTYYLKQIPTIRRVQTFQKVVTYRSHTLPAVRALDPKPEERQNGPRSNAEVTKICPIACTNGYWEWNVQIRTHCPIENYILMVNLRNMADTYRCVEQKRAYLLEWHYIGRRRESVAQYQ